MIRILGLITLIVRSKIVSGATVDRKRIQSMGPVEIYELSKSMYQMGHLSEAETIYVDTWDRHRSCELFQKGYLSVLLKTGQYRKMVTLRNIVGDENLEQIETAKECIKVLDSGDLEKIAELVKISPDSLEANLAVVMSFMNSRDPMTQPRDSMNQHQVKESLLRLEKIYTNHEDAIVTRIQFDLSIGNIESAIMNIERVNPTLAEKAKSVYNNIKMIVEDARSNMNEKLGRLEDVRKNLILGSQQGSFRNDKFNLLTHLYDLVLYKMVELGSSSRTISIGLYAKELFNRKKTPKTVAYFIKSLILDKKLDDAGSTLATYKTVLKEYGEFDGLEMFYNVENERFQREKEEKEKQKRAQEEREKQRQDQEKKQREEMEDRYLRPTDKAGTDFLGYYKVLNVGPKVTSSELMRKRIKKLKEVNAKVSKKKNLTQEQKDSEAMLVNKAYDVLSDPKKKKRYDLGIDPEKPAEMNYQNYNTYNGGGGFFDEDQMNDIFQAFFGGGGQRGGRQRRAQYIFM